MQAIADNARKLVGKQFLHQGRNPSAGLDCIGVWVQALRMSGIEVKDSRTYARYPSGVELHKRMREQFRRVSKQVAKPGDALVIRVPRHDEARHLAVYVGDDLMVHADANARAVRLEPVRWDLVEVAFRVRC